jgi:hypothetical protein
MGFVTNRMRSGSLIEVKPTFGACLEYYTFRYHALLFSPVDGPAEMGRFWQWEEKKMQRFFDDNREFCTYIRDGDTRRYRQMTTS